jgi:hypothetical protein
MITDLEEINKKVLKNNNGVVLKNNNGVDLEYKLDVLGCLHEYALNL